MSCSLEPGNIRPFCCSLQISRRIRTIIKAIWLEFASIRKFSEVKLSVPRWFMLNQKHTKLNHGEENTAASVTKLAAVAALSFTAAAFDIALKHDYLCESI